MQTKEYGIPDCKSTDSSILNDTFTNRMTVRNFSIDTFVHRITVFFDLTSCLFNSQYLLLNEQFVILFTKLSFDLTNSLYLQNCHFLSQNSLFQFLKIVIGIRKLSFNSQNIHSLFQKSWFNSQNCHLI